ncbi:MAG: HypC/HybG/HupF family hydrogenase formation chaperone [Armatimonadota bacterium]
MCLAVPLRVTEIDGSDAVAEQGGASVRIRVDLLDNVQVGDYVLVHAGFAIQKVSKEDAQETLRLLRELSDAVG